MTEEIKKRFLEDVADHDMTIYQDLGTSRRVKFRSAGSFAYHFELITWEGHLCITGDMGTYVFARVRDMFNLFLACGPELTINPQYWSEKLLAVDKTCNYKEFDREKFVMEVNNYVDGWIGDNKNPKYEHEGLRKAVDVLVFGALDDSPEEGLGAIRSFLYQYDIDTHFDFDDLFFDGLPEKYSHHFIWCLYAIVWGIRQYDQKVSSNS